MTKPRAMQNRALWAIEDSQSHALEIGRLASRLVQDEETPIRVVRAAAAIQERAHQIERKLAEILATKEKG